MARNTATDFPPELDDLLHPAQAFLSPQEVVDDPDLTIDEKRAILASWASDACAVEATPALRRPAGGPVVMIDDILRALRELDELARSPGATWARRQLRRSELEKWRRSGSGEGAH